MITIPVRCLVSGFTHSSAYCLFSICYTYVTHYTCYTQYTQYTFDIWYMYIYIIYIYIYNYIYMYLIRMLVICQKICSVTIEVWPYATSGLSFWHRKAAGEPKGDTAPLENGVLGQLLGSGKFAENAEGIDQIVVDQIVVDLIFFWGRNGFFNSGNFETP